MAAAFESIAAEAGTWPSHISIDRGKEFQGACLELFRKHNVNVVLAYGVSKSAIVERFNRTLQIRVHRFMTEHRSRDFVRALQPVTRAYNNTVHSTIGVSPASVTWENQADLFKRYYQKMFKARLTNRTNPRFQIGERVLISISKSLALRSFDRRWSMQEYHVSRVYKTSPITYRVKDTNGRQLPDVFIAVNCNALHTVRRSRL